MMAFTTQFDDAGRKTYRPTTELEKLLQQDRITEADLQVFRPLRVHYLLRAMLQKRGFEHRSHTREWVKHSLNHASAVEELAKVVANCSRAISSMELSCVGSTYALSGLTQAMKAGGWWWDPATDVFMPPNKPDPSKFEWLHPWQKAKVFDGVPRRKPKAKPRPKPVKRIIPPWKLKRKLAL